MQLATLDRIGALRLRVAQIVDRYDDGDAEFSDDVKRWLREVEEALAAARIPAMADVAALRAAIVSAENGALPAGITFSGRPTPRRIRDAVAADALRHANDAVVNATSAAAAQFAEAERLIGQILPVATRKGLSSWSAIESDADLGPIATHVIGLVGRGDALVLFDRAIAV